ncbi:hypothetical protein THAOC_25699, partial [Thalassiosira oceanica]
VEEAEWEAGREEVDIRRLAAAEEDLLTGCTSTSQQCDQLGRAWSTLLRPELPELAVVGLVNPVKSKEDAAP